MKLPLLKSQDICALEKRRGRGLGGETGLAQNEKCNKFWSRSSNLTVISAMKNTKNSGVHSEDTVLIFAVHQTLPFHGLGHVVHKRLKRMILHESFLLISHELATDGKWC